ncbi:MAG: OmpA family protein [Pseudomonadota bacterium]
MLKWPAIVVFLATSPITLATGERLYLADMHQSEWVTTESRLECILLHTIPRYGVANFRKLAGEEISFSLSAFSASNRAQNVTIDSDQPEWRYKPIRRTLGNVNDNGTHVPFQLSAGPAKRLLYELESGMRPMFSYKDAADATELLKIGLSSVNFRDAHQQFNHCVAKLLPYGFDDISFTKVNFEFNGDVLSADDKERIDKVVEYVKTDRKVRRIVVGGHADWIGTELYNSDLSKFRTLRVVDYLTRRGVPEGLIQHASYGESIPLRSNESESGRAANRRVTLEVIRDYE